MSYDIYLTDPVTGETLELDAEHYMAGGTYAIGGTTRMALNVTYNYAPHFYRVFDRGISNSQTGGIRSIYGLTGAESLPLLDKAIATLDDDVSDDYWQPTEGNAKRALLQLRALATMRPDGVWRGD